MKQTFGMDNLDCAHCAAKMEAAISKIDGVTAVTVSFFAQKMILEGADEKWDQIVKEACKAVKKIDRDCSVITK